MLFVACPTCVIVGNVASVCPTVIVIVETFYVFGVDELSSGEMLPPWSLLLSSAGVAVCIACIPTVSIVASVATVAVSFPLCSVVTTAIYVFGVDELSSGVCRVYRRKIGRASCRERV